MPCLGTADKCEARDFKTPTAPAFAIIGTVPSEVETPRSLKELSLALYASFGGGKFGQDVALDVAPYWLFAHPGLSYDEYVGGPSLLQLASNTSVSAATVAVPDALATDVGLGIRTHLFWPDASNRDPQSTVIQLEQKLFAIQGRELVKSRWSKFECDADITKPVCQGLKPQYDALVQVEGELAEAGKALQEALVTRTGFSVSIAGAISSRSAADKFKPNDFQRAAGWLTGGYRGSWFELMAMGRVTSVDAPSSLLFFDGGGRVGAFKPTWGLNGELVYRGVKGDDPPVDNSVRLAATFEFKVTDEIFVSATYGKEAADEASTGKTFALFGFNFQAGERTITEL